MSCALHVLLCILQAIHSVAWHHEGKQFVCSHSDGTLTTWNIRAPAKPAQIITPHGRNGWYTQCYYIYTYMERNEFFKSYTMAETLCTERTVADQILVYVHASASTLHSIACICAILSSPGKQPKDGRKPEPCKPILKVEYKTTRAG